MSRPDAGSNWLRRMFITYADEAGTVVIAHWTYLERSPLTHASYSPSLVCGQNLAILELLSQAYLS